MAPFAFYPAAAVAEIAGCFGFWAGLRLGKSPSFRVCALLLGFLLTRVDSVFAGRAFSASLVWLWAVEGQRPDRWDVLGGAICLKGTLVIRFGPRPQI